MYLTDEEFNELYDTVAANDALTPDQMDALTKMRDDMYARMSYMKDTEDYREKYLALENRYRERWNVENTTTGSKDEEIEEETEMSYEKLWED